MNDTFHARRDAYLDHVNETFRSAPMDDSARVGEFARRLGYTRWENNDEAIYGTDAWVPITGMRTPHAVVSLVRQTLGGFALDATSNLRYVGFRRAGAGEEHTGGYDAVDGIAMVEVDVRPVMGRPQHFDVPVVVRAGAMLRPSVCLYEGEPAVISQPFFDEILERGSRDRQQHVQKNIFTGPAGPSRISPHRFAAGLAPIAYEGPPREDIRAAIRGDGSWARPKVAVSGEEAKRDFDGLEPAERKRPSIVPGTKVYLKKETVAHSMGSTYDKIPSGAGGFVVRDMDGTGSRFMVDLDDHGVVVIDREFLT